MGQIPKIPSDKKVQWIFFIYFFIKHMLWVLKEPSMKRFLSAPIHMFRLMDHKINTILRMKILLIWTYVSGACGN